MSASGSRVRSNSDDWQFIEHTGTHRDYRLHMFRGGMPACGIAVDKERGFTGTVIPTPRRFKTCKRCAQLK